MALLLDLKLQVKQALSFHSIIVQVVSCPSFKQDHLLAKCMAVFKFVELPENNEKLVDQKSRVKFKIMSLKVKGPMDYVPELVRCVHVLLVFIMFNMDLHLVKLSGRLRFISWILVHYFTGVRAYTI